MGNLARRFQYSRRGTAQKITPFDHLLIGKQIPKSRFDLSQFYDPQATQTKGRKMTSKLGNFIEDVWSFDNSFFNTSAREARS